MGQRAFKTARERENSRDKAEQCMRYGIMSGENGRLRSFRSRLQGRAFNIYEGRIYQITTKSLILGAWIDFQENRAGMPFIHEDVSVLVVLW